ncbi:uncharacterized protein LOC107610162 isoform X2 [Arachis ipaensis]|uniref:uncharacterized protein LOC107610162 isoform X2 n=1 Tax=Arachis ipaensis TaxID=130454 RepID=UPI000A2B563F|nr:uncharacterized protein LOC107610162 isoform X2 [Arachis ipaensis]XP_025667543.1 uncharacterized protein LOC112765893 isoform X2 [Arachis hypogaea]
MYNNNSVSIPISDHESDEHGGVRVHTRRKRKIVIHRGNHDFREKVLRKLLRHWILIIILLASALFVFEAFTIGRKPDSTVTSELRTPNKNGGIKSINSQLALGKEPQHDNLNRLDPPQGESSLVGRNATFSLARFNLFTGNQTLEQRDTSFEIKESMMVHCGFYSLNGGFKISDEDKTYMHACKVVVSTCAFGGGDDLYQPIGMSEASLKKVCYVAFWDEITLRAQELADHRIGENGFIGKWRVVIVRDLPFVDQRLNGKIPKMLSHRLFPQAKFSIWVDSKSQFRRDPLGVLEALLWHPHSVFAISEHGARSSVYDEAKAVVKKNKAKPEEVEVQLNQYRKDGLPEDKRFIGKKALCEASVIVRKHMPLTNLLMCLWFNEVVRFTSRDQLSFPYVLWRLNAFKYINTFPVCTRKDLVNSMGHIRKAKPLQLQR